jgi:hypothetical protein
MTQAAVSITVAHILGPWSVTRSTKLGTIPERPVAWVPLLLSPEAEKVHYVYYRLWIGK